MFVQNHSKRKWQIAFATLFLMLLALATEQLWAAEPAATAQTTAKTTDKYSEKYSDKLADKPATVSQEAAAQLPLLTREDAVKEMVRNGLRWKQTRTIGEEASALKSQAQAALNPRVLLGARDVASRVNLAQYGLNDTQASTDTTFYLVGGEFEYALRDLKSESRIHAAEANEQASLASEKQYQSDLVFYTHLAYLSAQKFQSKMNVFAKNEKRNLMFLSMAEAKLKSGTGLPIDVMRAKAVIGLDKLKQLDAESNLIKAKNDLAGLMGRNSTEFSLEELKFEPYTSPGDISSDLKSAVKDRPDVKYAFRIAEAAGELVHQEENESKAKITFIGDGGVAGQAYLNLSGQGPTPVGSVGVMVTMPWLTGGYLEAKVQEAKVKKNRAELQAQQVELEANSSLTNALAQLHTAEATVKMAESQLAIADQELEMAGKKMKSGASGGVETSTSQRNLSSALESQVDALFAYEAAKANYLKQIGKLSVPQ